MINLPTAGSPGAWDAIVDRPYTPKEIAKIAAGAVASLVIVGWILVMAIIFTYAL